jgi:radical SAM-linked protein
MMRIRITFEKSEQMRYTGHLDLHRSWERTFRRASLPLAYSQGFHPQPRINLASALPLGFTSSCEMADIWLEKELALQEVQTALKKAAPPGIKIVEIEQAREQEPALQTRVAASEYQITLMDTVQRLDQRVEELLAQESLPRQRRGKRYDLRPLIEELYRLPDNDQCQPRLFLRMTSQPGATGRPEELLSALDIPPASALVHRTRIIFEEQTQPPSVAAAPPPPPAG